MTTKLKTGDALHLALQSMPLRREDLYEQLDGWFYDDDAEQTIGNEYIRVHYAIAAAVLTEDARHLTTLPPSFCMVPVRRSLVGNQQRPNGFVKRKLEQEGNFSVKLTKLSSREEIPPQVRPLLMAEYGDALQDWPRTILVYTIML